MRIIKTPRILPYKVKITASYPFPFNNNSCPGKTDKVVSSSGAPKNIEGIKLMKASEIVMLTIKTTRTIGWRKDKKKVKIERRKTEIKLTWIPGNIPAIVPTRIPNNKAKNNSVNIKSIENLNLYYFSFYLTFS